MPSRFGLVVAVGFSLLAAAGARAQTPLATAFTYQGELASAGTPPTGTYDLRFRLYDAATGGTQIGGTLCSDNLAVANGRFAASLDFGAAFIGQRRFLEIEVRQDTGLGCSDASGYTVLTPRQELTATPNATFAQTAAAAGTALAASNASNLGGQPASFFTNSANLTGTIADSRLSGNVARLDSNQTFTGLLNFTNPANVFAGNGAGLTNLSGASITAGTLTRSSLNTDVQSGLGTNVLELQTVSSVVTGVAPTSVAVSGSYAYVLCQTPGTLQVFNISNPAAPALLASFPAGNGPSSIAISSSYAFVLNYPLNLLQVFNISNPAAPTLAAVTSTGQGPATVAVSGSYAYVANDVANTLQIFNISNPAAPSLVSTLATGATGSRFVAVSGAFAYVVSQNSNTLQIINVSNPASPAVTSSITAGNLPNALAVVGGYAYVLSSGTNTVEIFAISNPANPTFAARLTTGADPFSIAVSNNYAFVVSLLSNSLDVFSVSNPAAPTFVGSVVTGAFPFSVTASGPSVYVVNRNANSLQLVSAASRVRLSAPIAAASLAGADGSGLTSIPAANLFGSVPAGNLTSVPAANLTGSVPAASLTNLPAANLTGSVPAARLTNVPAANLTGSVPAASLTNLPVGSLIGSIPAVNLTNVPAASLTGSVPPSVLTNVPAANLTGGVPATSLTSVPAGNLSGGTIPQSVLPVTAWFNTQLTPISISSVFPAVTVPGTAQTFPMRQGVAVVSWSTTASTNVALCNATLRVKAVTNGVTSLGPMISFLFGQAFTQTTISGNAVLQIPSTGSTTFSLEVARFGGTGTYNTSAGDSFTATIINIGQ